MDDGILAQMDLSVADTGIGIPADKQQTVFEKFTQADASTTRHFGGTGLGLTITRYLVQMMGGHIRVESQVDQGSTFHCLIPFRFTEPAKRPPKPGVAELAALPALVVDDHPANRQLLQEMLSSWQMRPVLAENGPDALARLRADAEKDPIELALVDLCMPGMDGVELCRQIQADPSRKIHTVLMLSSCDDVDQVARCRAAGLDQFLVKPLRQRKSLRALLLARGGKPHGQQVGTTPAGSGRSATFLPCTCCWLKTTPPTRLWPWHCCAVRRYGAVGRHRHGSGQRLPRGDL